MDDSTLVYRLESHQWRDTEDGRILVFPRYKGERPDFHGFYEFGEFEAMVWRLLDKPTTFGKICDDITYNLEKIGNVEIPERKELIEELSGFLQEMNDNKLIRIEKGL